MIINLLLLAVIIAIISAYVTYLLGSFEKFDFKTFDLLIQTVLMGFIFIPIIFQPNMGQGLLGILLIAYWFVLPYQAVSSIFTIVIGLSTNKLSRPGLAKLVLLVAFVGLLILWQVADRNYWTRNIWIRAFQDFMIGEAPMFFLIPLICLLTFFDLLIDLFSKRKGSIPNDPVPDKGEGNA